MKRAVLSFVLFGLSIVWSCDSDFEIEDAPRPSGETEIPEAGPLPVASTSGFGQLAPDDRELPEQVRLSSESVFLLLLHTDRELPHRSYDVDETKIRIDDKCAISPPSMVESMNCDALRVCAENGEEECIEPYLNAGTAFIVDNNETGSVLATNWHVLDDQFAIQIAFLGGHLATLPAKERLAALMQMQPIFTLIDKNGEVVYNSAEPSRFRWMGDMIGATQIAEGDEQTVAKFLEDAALIQTPLQLGKKIPVRQAGIPVSTRSYAVGFPIRTERDDGRSADGRSLRVSPGEILTEDEFNKRLKSHLSLSEETELIVVVGEDRSGERGLDTPIARLDEVSDPLLAALGDDESGAEEKAYSVPDRGVLYSSVDTVPGNSGGPLLDETGAVMGMVTATFSTHEQYSSAGSISLLVSDIERAAL